MHEPSNNYKYKQIEKQKKLEKHVHPETQKTKKDTWEYLPLLGLGSILAPRGPKIQKLGPSWGQVGPS